MLLLILLSSPKIELPFASRSEKTYLLNPKQLNLSLHATNGTVRIIEGKSGQVVIKQLIRADDVAKLSETKLETTLHSDGIRCETIDDFKTAGKPSTRYPGAVDYSPPTMEITLIVPPTINLKVDTSNAPISVGRISGRVEVRSNNGNINVKTSAWHTDAIQARSRNGKVTSENPISSSGSPKVILESYNGDIFVEKPLPVVRIQGAMCWNGKSFTKANWFVVDGRFTKDSLQLLSTDLDVSGKFVAPAYGDAHCHHIDGEYLASKMSEFYVAEGTLYAQSMGNHSSTRRDSEKIVNRQKAIDVSFANGGFTSGWGHPAFLYENMATPANPKMTPEQRSDFIKSRPRREIGDSYWLAESAQQLDEIWPRYLATDPDLTKVFLVNTAKRRENQNGLAGSIGLTAEMLAMVTERAHDSGLKVYAHVDTRTDVEIALKAGVDGLAHMPGYGTIAPNDPDFSMEGLTKRKGQELIVQPTTAIASSYSKGDELAQVKANQKRNLAALRRLGARFVIGSDRFFTTQKAEVLDWLSLGVSSREVYHSLVTATPQSIFPNRAVGHIREGYEANFVVLTENPLPNLEMAFLPVGVYKYGVLCKSP